MNKEALGLTSSFQKINSIVRKSDEEILTEMEQLDEKIDALNIDESAKETIGLAVDIVRIYCTSNVQNLTETPSATINVFEDNKIVESQIVDSDSITSDENNPDDNADKIKKETKDSPFISYKIALGLIIIPFVCTLMLGVFLFAASYNFV